MSTDRVIFAKDGKADWPAGKPAVTKIVLGTPPPQQGSAEEFITAKIPENLAERFPSLTHLHLWGIKNLKQLPPLPAGLKTLDVRNCQALSALPDALPEALEILDTGRCGALPALPAALPAGLQELFIDGCKSLAEGALPTLPATLEVLDASATRGVNTLPGALLDEKKYPALRDLRVEPGVRIGEHVAGPDVLAPFQGKNALETLRAWWRGIQESGADTTPYVKVFLLGNGQAGKTQLCRLLSGQPLTEGWDSTHGAQLADIPPGAGRLALPGVGLAVWDFGGQDIYHGTHALFTDSHALYVIVWTRDPARQGEREAKPKELRYWLEYVAALSKPGEGAPAKGCRVVLAESGLAGGDSEPDAQIPEGLIRTIVGYDLNPKLKEEHQLAAGDRVLERLREQAEAAALENQGTLPKSWAAVREALRGDEVRANRLLSSGQFQALCADRGIGDDEGIRSVRGYLHQCGAIFHKPGLFDGRIVVDQQWALDAIYAVLDRHPDGVLRRPGRNGSFTIQELKRTVWSGKNLTDEEATLLVQMMEQCNVCFEWGRNDDGETVWLAPELLPAREGLQSHLIETLRTAYPVPVKSQVFRYDFLHDGILRGIMARVGGLAGTGAAYWKSGFCVYDRASGIYVVVEARLTPDRGAGRGEILAELFGPADSRAPIPWKWITALLEEQRPMPDPADLKAAAVRAVPEEFFGGPSESAGAVEFEKAGFRGGWQGVHAAPPEWVITVEAHADFATSRRATIRIQKDGGRLTLPPMEKEFPACAKPSPADFASYLRGRHTAPGTFEQEAAEFGKALTKSLRDPGLKDDHRVSEEFGAACKQAGSFSTFRFQGGPEFQRIPWELMQVSQGLAPALRFGFQRHRYALTEAEPIFPRSETLKVLWVTSRPLGWQEPGADAIWKPVQNEVRNRGVVIEVLPGGSLKELHERISAEAYHVVHLDMHGGVVKWADISGWDHVEWNHREPLGALREWQGEQAILLFSEGAAGSKIVPVTAEELGRVMEHDKAPPLLTLNACQSGVMPGDPGHAALPAYLVEAGVPGVVGFQGSVGVDLAVIFYSKFFAVLAPTNRGSKVLTGDVEYAVREARNALRLNPDRGSDRRMDWWAPVYYASRNLQLFRR